MKTRLAVGYKSFGESGVNWWLFQRMTQEEALEYCLDYDIVPYTTGPGGDYARKPTIRHSASYTLITQFIGLDI